MSGAESATSLVTTLPLSRALSTVAEILKPAPKRTADEWADACRVLPDDAPEPGPWRSARVPYFIPIMRAFSDRKIRTIVVVTATQMAKTECIFNVIGHRLDDGPRVPILYFGPTQKNVKSISGDRFKKMLQSTPRLWTMLEKGQRDSMYEKFIAGVRVGFGWAGSASEVATHPAGIAVCDERDRMEDDVKGEGDPGILIRARTKNYRGISAFFSTPTIDGASAIQREFKKGTMERWAWPCVHCGEFFVPELKLLIWPEGATPEQAKESAIVACPSCGGTLTTLDRDRTMNPGGKFIPHELDDQDRYIPVERRRDISTRSFWVSGLCSPWVTFGETAELLVAAYRGNDQEEIQGVVNTYGGEWFAMKGDAPPYEDVLECRGEYEARTRPEGVQLITAGVDVQKLGLYYVVRGWGFNIESWLLAHGYIPGETKFDSVWLLLARELVQLYGGMGIARTFVDSGYRPGDPVERPAHQVYMFARRYRATVFPTKGHDFQDLPVKSRDIDVSVGGRIIKGGVKLYHLDTDYLKRQIHDRIRWPKDQAGGFHLHRTVDVDYAKQLVAEECVTKASGRRIWIRSGANHYLDCEVNALAAAMTLQVHSLPEKPPERTPASARAASSGGTFINKPAGSFINR